MRQTAESVDLTARQDTEAVTPAGFWRRSLAYLIDWLLLAAVVGLLSASAWRRLCDGFAQLNALLQQWLLDAMFDGDTVPSPLELAQRLLHDPQLTATVQAAMAEISLAVLHGVAVLGVAAAVYFIAFEASSWQATPGKRALRLCVVDLQGRRLRAPRALLRFIAGTLSWLSLNLGHALAGWRTDRRALHDLVAGTQVLASGPTPVWALRVGIALSALLVAGLLALLARMIWLALQLAAIG